jgi:hypothetical protein
MIGLIDVDALRLEINRKDADKLRRVARALIDKAMDGDVSAIKEVADRLDGRVPQLVGGDRENPVQFQRIERVIVHIEHGTRADPVLIQQDEPERLALPIKDIADEST